MRNFQVPARPSVVALLSLVMGSSTAAGGIEVAARQTVVAERGRFAAGDAVEVDFALPRAAPVTIGIYADRPMGIGRRWYAHESTRVAAFKLAGKPGKQSFAFEVARIKPPAVPLPGAPEGQARKAPRPGEPGGLPGNYVIEVSDGESLGFVCIHVRPAGSIIVPSRTIPGFALGAVLDGKGNFIVADRQGWIGRGFSPVWTPLTTFPQASQGHSSNPVECFDIAVDSTDNVYVMTRNGAYKFAPDGQPAAWEGGADYLKHPYPSNTKNVLGVRLEPKRRKRYVFGPGGHGAGSKDYGPEDVKSPGFAFNWAGLAIDAWDNVYLGRMDPERQVQVFDAKGKHLRSLALPENVRPFALRFGKDGTLWVAQDGRLTGLDPQTAEVRKQVKGVGGRLLHAGPDGTLYTFGGTRLWRLTRDGEPLPFAAKAPYVKQNGRYLDLDPRASKVPEGTGGYTPRIASVVAGRSGEFFVLTRDTGDPNSKTPVRVMRFSPDGLFQVDTPAVACLPHETGNVFVGDEPAAIGLQLTNLLAEPADVALKATVTDLGGRTLATHTETRRVPPLASLSAPLWLDARELGYYTIDLEARSRGAVVASQRLFGGRVAERGNAFHPYSAFGSVRMEANPELLRRIGGGLNRNHDPVYWNSVEPRPGHWRLQPAGALDFYRARALPAMVILGYGEPWFNGGFARCRITRYDAYFNYVATVVRRHKGTAMMWQCWNEPNHFWHVPGPYRYEHYAMVLQATYAIAKAIDPETPVICDGFAGSAAELAKLAKLGAAGFTDGAPIHYPGAKTLAFDNMPLKGTVESKAAMVKELAAIRDRYFPGQPLLNTEEGLWGMADRTPRHGAELLPRIYVSQMAVGMDRLTWFECFSKKDPTYLLRGVHDGPWPAYFAYAAASRFLEDAQYVGALSQGLAQAHVFAVKGAPLIVAWSMQGERTLDVKGRGFMVTDWQGSAKKVEGLGLKLGPMVQYVTGADASIFQPLVGSRDKALARALATDSDEVIGLNDLFHAARAAERAALVKKEGEPRAVAAALKAVDDAANAVRKAEAGGACLRDARTALEIARRMAYFMKIAEGRGYATRLAPYVKAVARQVRRRAAGEKPWYPGVMLRVALDTTPIRAAVEPQIRAALKELGARRRRAAELARLEAEAGQNPAKREQLSKLRAQVNADGRKRLEPPPLDEQFPPQVTKKPGEQVEIEMTLYNWTDQELRGTLSPALPAGWKGAKVVFRYSVQPTEFARFTTTATVPADAAAGVYAIGVRTRHRGVEQRELRTHRVQVGR